MSNRVETEDVLHQMRVCLINTYPDSVSIEEFVQQTDDGDRGNVKNNLRILIGNGEVTSTPDWEYKAGSELRNRSVLDKEAV